MTAEESSLVTVSNTPLPVGGAPNGSTSCVDIMLAFNTKFGSSLADIGIVKFRLYIGNGGCGWKYILNVEFTVKFHRITKDSRTQPAGTI